MEDRFQAPERAGIGENDFAQRGPVDRVSGGNAGKSIRHRLHRRAAGTEQEMHRGVGVEHGHAHAAQHRRRGAFAGADAAGETQNFHGGIFILNVSPPARHGAVRIARCQER